MKENGHNLGRRGYLQLLHILSNLLAINSPLLTTIFKLYDTKFCKQRMKIGVCHGAWSDLFRVPLKINAFFQMFYVDLWILIGCYEVQNTAPTSTLSDK